MKACAGGRARLATAGLLAVAAASTCVVASTAPATAPAPASASAPACAGTVYLTLDTGNMRHAHAIADMLARRGVQVTFFLADEATWPDRHGSALGPEWDAFWRARAAEGHAFGSHTWRHGSFRRDLAGGAVEYRPQFGEQAGRTLALDTAQVCAEIGRVDEAFRRIARRPLDRLWRAPGGRTTPNALAAARSCGWTHVGWAPAGFLGDELPSESHPNQALLARALARIRDGDILMAHLGIWSRNDPFAPMLAPLIEGLQRRGLCFATLRSHPDPSR